MGSVSSKGRLLSTMARGPKRHMKRLNAPKHWMLDKMGGTWAPRPSTGPHKLRECLPLVLVLRNRLKYALTKKEVQQILMQRLIKVDGKVRTDPNTKVHDTVKVDIATGKATDMIKFETGATVVITKGQNQGRVGVITGREKHIGSFEIVHIKDTKQRSFATRISNVFCIAAKDDTEMVSLPRGKGLRDNILEERKKRLGY